MGTHSPGLDVIEEVLPAGVDVAERPVDLRLLGLITGRQELLAQLLKVALIVTEEVDLLHAILHRERWRGLRKGETGRWSRTVSVWFWSHWPESYEREMA